MRAWLRDPVAPSLLILAGLVVAGFVTIGLGWRVASTTLYVALQVPAVISGGLGGLALIAFGSGLLSTQLGRRWAARERQERQAAVDEAALLLATITRNRR